jgi:hypothetical protein
LDSHRFATSAVSAEALNAVEASTRPVASAAAALVFINEANISLSFYGYNNHSQHIIIRGDRWFRAACSTW